MIAQCRIRPLRPLFTLAIAIALAFATGTSRAEDAKPEKARVIAANESFYKAFRTRDMTAMDAIWSKQKHVSVIHPGWAGISGREAVMKSWKAILEGNPPDIRALKPSVIFAGSSAYVICYEQVSNGLLIATNIFVKEDDDWRMIHHHAGPTSAKVPQGQPT